jgi:glycosyltransferase involved in cell wall biosynthesis
MRVQSDRPPIVQAIHSIDAHRPWWQALLDRATARRVDLYIANSRVGAEFVVQERKVPRDRTVIVPNGIDIELYVQARAERTAARAELGIGGEQTMILTVANLRPPKGLDVLVGSAALLAAEGCDFVWLIAGGGPEQAWLRAELGRRGLGDRVRLLGFRRDVARLLAACDVFCLTSRREGVPVSILEAMAVGRPVVATRVGGVAELVADGETGILVEPSSAGAVHRALAAFVDDAERRELAGKAGAARAALEFTVDASARSIAAHYQRLLDRRAQG